MLSLAGVKCVIANQWHCTLPDNSANVQHAFLGKFFSGLQAVFNIQVLIQFVFTRRKLDIDEYMLIKPKHF